MQVNIKNILNKMLNAMRFYDIKLSKLFIMLLLNAVICYAAACGNNKGGEDNSPLPSSRPGDISFRYYVNGGMMYYSEELFVSADSCYYTVNSGGAVSKAYFKLGTGELDKLYKVFTGNDFDRITTYTQKVYDRGGESISLNWGKDKSCGVNNSGITFVESSWSSEWNACVEAMTEIIKTEIPKHTRNYEIHFDNSLFGREISMQLNNNSVIHKSTIMSENDIDTIVTRAIKVMPGSQMLSVNMDKKFEMFKLNSDSTKAVLIYLSGDTLKHKFIK